MAYIECILTVFQPSHEARHGEWEELDKSAREGHIQSGLHLRKGSRYRMKVAGVNGADLAAPYETKGITIDPTPPVVYK